MLKTILIYICLLFSSLGYCQQLVYSDIIYGGVTGGGFTTGSSFGIVTCNLKIPQNSKIIKSYLLATRNHLANDITVTLNGNNYEFSNSSIVIDNFMSFDNGTIKYDTSSIHLIDITDDIDSSVLSYTLTTPMQANQSYGMYSHYYIYIVYENPLLPKINYYIHANNQDVKPVTIFNINNLNPINNNNPVGLELFNYFFCDTIQDGSYIRLNNDTLGISGGDDLNSNLWSCTGTYANFAHYNDTLFGLDDDTPDSLVSATDVLADIKSYLNLNDTNLILSYYYQSSAAPYSNPIAAIMLSYSTPCDTFTTSISTTNDTICPWGSTQLQATGGSSYSWFGAFGGLNDTSIANPIASPNQTTTYICTITNDSGCVKTEQIKVWVDACVGINDKNTNTANISIYPNPSNGNFTISSDEQLTQITISNTLGQVVYQQLLNNYSADLLLNTPKGLYFVTTKTAKGSFTQKLILR